MERERRLVRPHVLGSMAHASMLGQAGLITRDEARRLTRGLAELLETRPDLGAAAGHSDPRGTVVAHLVARVGPDLARKLDIGRGRADQLLTDLRLWTRTAILDTLDALVALRQALVEVAERHGGQLMPGYSGLQRSEPLLLAHHLIAYVEMFYRDGNRLRENYVRADILPLGAGEGAGVADAVDRVYLASLLGMHTSTRNSLDAVGDRDFVVEHLASLAIIAMHLSRLAEEVLLWSSAEFGFLDPRVQVATAGGRPPLTDLAQHVRGRTGTVYGALMAMLTTLKGLPVGYSHDLQADPGPYFDAVDTVQQGLETCTTLIVEAHWHPDRLAEAAGPDATGRVAAAAIRGGTAPDQVLPAVQESYDRINTLRTWLTEQRARQPTVERLLQE
jgi:argininosuccinate lyase